MPVTQTGRTNLVAGVGQMLLVLGPGDGLVVQEVGNGGYIGRCAVVFIVVHAESITSNSSKIIGLGGMSSRIEVGPRLVISTECRVDYYPITYSRIP